MLIYFCFCFLVGTQFVVLFLDYLDHKKFAANNFSYIKYKEFKEMVDGNNLVIVDYGVTNKYLKILVENGENISCNEWEVNKNNSYVVFLTFYDYIKYRWWFFVIRMKNRNNVTKLRDWWN